MPDLHALARLVRDHPGLRGKRALRAVSDALGGDGGDAALLETGPGEGRLAVAAEAIWPPFVAAAPRPAGVAGVVTVLNDLAATGARPLAVLDAVVGGDPGVVGEVLAGLRAGAALYGVPVVGGHTTVGAGAGASLSTFAVGVAAAPLRASAARAGDAVCLAACLEGEAVEGGEGRFFSHLRGPRRGRAAQDLALLPEAAEAGEAWAARDVSMPGVAGSLLQLLESAGGLGCALELDALPRPPGLELGDWIVTFPSYGFLLVGDPDALGARFARAGLACGRVGTLDESGALRLAAGGEEALVWDLREEPLTGMGPS